MLSATQLGEAPIGKSKFNEKLLHLTAFLCPRAEWWEPLDYPSPQTANPAIWAWEFLRRNVAYELAYRRTIELTEGAEQSGQQSSGEADAGASAATRTCRAIALAWGLKQMWNPEVAQVDDDAFLALDVPSLLQPTFHASDVIGGLRGTASYRMVTPCTVDVRSDQVLVRWNLDGDDDAQAKQLKRLLMELKATHGRRATRPLEVATYRLALNETGISSIENAAEDMTVEQPPFKVHLEKCHSALRCLDAYSTYAVEANEGAPLSQDECREFAKQLAAVFASEEAAHHGAAEYCDWDTEKVLTSLHLGMAYALDGRYLHLATPSR